MAKLYFRYGAMGSSKSANILMVRYNYEERGQYAVLLKPRTDNRDGEREIQSRMGLSAPADYVDEFLKEISQIWNANSTEYLYHGKKVDAVLVDEAQFLSPEEVDISRRTTANLLISMGSRFLFYLSMNSICLFSNVFLTSLTQAFCQLICKALLSGSV